MVIFQFTVNVYQRLSMCLCRARTPVLSWPLLGFWKPPVVESPASFLGWWSARLTRLYGDMVDVSSTAGWVNKKLTSRTGWIHTAAISILGRVFPSYSIMVPMCGASFLRFRMISNGVTLHYHFSSHERYLASMVYQTAPKKWDWLLPTYGIVA